MSKKKIPTKTRTSIRTPKAAARADYSQRFLERYGRSLSRQEIRLVQGYRGMAPEAQLVLLNTASALVPARPKGGAR
jgi:hypothetical protein